MQGVPTGFDTPGLGGSGGSWADKSPYSAGESQVGGAALGSVSPLLLRFRPSVKRSLPLRVESAEEAPQDYANLRSPAAPCHFVARICKSGQRRFRERNGRSKEGRRDPWVRCCAVQNPELNVYRRIKCSQSLRAFSFLSFSLSPFQFPFYPGCQQTTRRLQLY
jgi:hypothetical protein